MQEDSAHDFGRNIVPGSIEAGDKVYAYVFQDAETKVQLYWRDVGNVDAFYEANLELTYVAPELNLYDQEWPIWTYQAQLPPAKFVLDDDVRHGRALNSLVSGGCIVSGALVRESVLFSNVRVAERSLVERSIILPDVEIGRDCRIVSAIVDENTVIPDGMVVGEDAADDRRRFYVTREGVVLVTREMVEALL
jgi:glucose-1-phosphate adenylyltransferase